MLEPSCSVLLFSTINERLSIWRTLGLFNKLVAGECTLAMEMGIGGEELMMNYKWIANHWGKIIVWKTMRC
jgi:hypothetical protein